MNREFAVSEGGRTPEEIHCDEYHASFTPDPTTEEYYPKKMAQADHEAHAKGFMMRTDRYKYISRINRKDELYDMVSDPGERHNIIDDPELKDMVMKMKEDLLYWLESTSDIVPFKFDSRWNQRGLLAFASKMLTDTEYEKVEKAMAEGKTFFNMGEVVRFGKSH